MTLLLVVLVPLVLLQRAVSFSEGLKTVYSRNDLLYNEETSTISVLKNHYLLYSETDVCSKIAHDAWKHTPNQAMRTMAPFSIETDFGFKLLRENRAVKGSIARGHVCVFIALEKGTPQRMVTHIIRPNLFVVKLSDHQEALSNWLKDIQMVEVGVTAAYLGERVLVECKSGAESHVFELAPGMHAGCYADLGSKVRVITKFEKVDTPSGSSYSGVELNNWVVGWNSVYITSYLDQEGRVRELTKSRFTTYGGRDAHEDNVHEKAGVHLTEDTRWSLIREMINSSVERSREVHRTFSSHGFKLGRLPGDLWASMSAYYYNNQEKGKLEFWTPTHVITNHHESSTKMMFPPLVLKAYWHQRLLSLVQSWLDERISMEEFKEMKREQKRDAMRFSEHFQDLGANSYNYGSNHLTDINAFSSSDNEACYTDEEEDYHKVGVVEDELGACYLDQIAQSRFSIQQTSLYGIREYRGKSRLLQHVDIKSTHAASIIVNVAQMGVEEPWPLEIFDHSDRLHEVVMAEGDILYYESARNVHARTHPFQGEKFANIFAHYRPLVPLTSAGDDSWFARRNPFGTHPPLRNLQESGKENDRLRRLPPNSTEVVAEDLWLNSAVVLRSERDLLDQWRDNTGSEIASESYTFS